MVYAKNSVPIEAIPNESSDSARQRLYENSHRRERDTTASRHPTWLPDRSPAHTDQKLRTGLYCAQITLSSLVLAFVEDYDSGKPTPILPTLMNKAELQGRINHLNREDPRHQGELA